MSTPVDNDITLSLADRWQLWLDAIEEETDLPPALAERLMKTAFYGGFHAALYIGTHAQPEIGLEPAIKLLESLYDEVEGYFDDMEAENHADQPRH